MARNTDNQNQLKYAGEIDKSTCL